MVKKRLADGRPCGKCVQAEETLRNRGHWDRITEVVWAVEGEPESPGMRLAARHAVDLAPFFIVERPEREPVIHTSVLKLIKQELSEAKAPTSGAVLGEWSPEQAAANIDAEDAQGLLHWALTRYGADCAISFSGAEDVVLIDMASRLGLPFSVFSLDTGRLHPETYVFMEKVRTHYGVEIELFSPDPQLLQPFVRRKGLFSFYEDGHQECCSIRKIEPLRRALATRRAWVSGQRKDQSVTRLHLAHIERDAKYEGKQPLVKLNPLANWTSGRVWSYIREHGVPYNELHERGMISIGCQPCTRAVRPGEHERAGRWWWEEETKRECGLHVGTNE